MVRADRRRAAVFGVALLLLAAMPASAQSVLEQMQTEVAAIVARAKSAVVSIEDVPTDVQRAQGLESSSALAKGETLAAEVDNKRKRLEERIARVQKALKGQPEEKDDFIYLKRPRAEVERELADMKKQLEIAKVAAQAVGAFTAQIPPSNAPKSGTGFAIERDYVVTTADVLEGMKYPVVVTDSGIRIKAAIVGIDSELNVGLVKLKAKADIPTLKLGNSGSVAPGHFAIIIGNQNGQMNSVALTLVAGVRDEAMYSGNHLYRGLIQIAGTVGAGTSGAPLLNARGEVIGIMAAVPEGDWVALNDAPTVGGMLGGAPALPAPANPKEKGTPPPTGGLGGSGRGGQRSVQSFSSSFVIVPRVTSAGFAIPVNEMRVVVEDLRAGRTPVRTWLGVALLDEGRVVEEHDIVQTIWQVKIEGIYPDSPALRGGLQPGDVLLSLNGKPVRRTPDVRATIARLRPGETVACTVQRGGGKQTLSLQLDKRPAQIKPPITKPLKR